LDRKISWNQEKYIIRGRTWKVYMKSTSFRANRKFTYQDYLTWPDDEKWEIIDGIPYNMTRAIRLFVKLCGNTV